MEAAGDVEQGLAQLVDVGIEGVVFALKLLRASHHEGEHSVTCVPIFANFQAQAVVDQNWISIFLNHPILVMKVSVQGILRTVKILNSLGHFEHEF